MGVATKENGELVQSAATPIKSWLGFLAMILGMFMAVFDIQVVASSLANLQAGLSATPDEIGWVQTAYLIAEVVMIPLTGLLSRLLSTRVLFACSCAGFTAMSVACAFAWNLESMIIFRTLQGLAGAAMIPTVFSIPYVLFTADKHEKCLIVVGLTATMAPTLGPAIGGWITDTWSWRWIFLVNLPLGVIATYAVWRLIDVDKPNRSLLKAFDFLGLTLMALCLGSLQFALEEGARWDWLDDPTIRAFTALAIIAGVAFVWRALTAAQPIVDIRAFRDRNFSVGCFYSFVFGVALYGSTYMLPLYLAQIRNETSLAIGTIMIVTGLFQFLSAPVAATLAKYLDLRIVLSLGIMLFAVGMLLNSTMDANTNFAALFVPQAVRGLALMLCFLPINTITLGTLPLDRLANASGLYNLMRNLGGAIGIATINTVYLNRLYLHAARLSEQVPIGRYETEAALDALAAKLSTMAPDAEQRLAAMKITSQLLTREAAVMAYNDLFLITGIALLLTLTLMMLIRRPAHDGIPIAH